MTKILYITNGITGSGGLERVLSVKASMLSDDFEYEVHIVSLNEAGIEPFYQFSTCVKRHFVSSSGSPLKYFMKYKNGIQGIVDQVQPNIISVCDDGLKGFFLPRLIRTDAKWIYERHVSKLAEVKTSKGLISLLVTKAKWFLMDQLAQRFSKFVLLTKGNMKEWPTLRNIVVISNPLPFTTKETAQLTNKVVICVGKISYQKGQDLLVNAWAKVHEKFPDWHLHLYGKENSQFLNTSKLSKNIFYFAPTKEIHEKYLNSAVYVMSSRYEGFGMVLIEAMECGVPCISFDCDYGPGDIITDGEDGILVKNGDVDSLANKIMWMIEDDDIRRQMGKTAKETVRRYAPKSIVAEWDKLFKSLIA